MPDQQVFQSIAKRSPVVPVLVIDDVRDAAPLARALREGGATAVEVTLRTPDALAASAEIKRACPDMKVGAGTVVSPDDVKRCLEAGVDFIVTPGATDRLIRALQLCPVPVCPGVGTASEAMHLADMGFVHQKFFPAEASGGVAFLKALGGPLQSVSFMPTGGVSVENLNDYLNLPNVFAVGGSWVAPPSLLAGRKFDYITKRMHDALETTR